MMYEFNIPIDPYTTSFIVETTYDIFNTQSQFDFVFLANLYSEYRSTHHQGIEWSAFNSEATIVSYVYSDYFTAVQRAFSYRNYDNWFKSLSKAEISWYYLQPGDSYLKYYLNPLDSYFKNATFSSPYYFAKHFEWMYDKSSSKLFWEIKAEMLDYVRRIYVFERGLTLSDTFFLFDHDNSRRFFLWSWYSEFWANLYMTPSSTFQPFLPYLEFMKYYLFLESRYIIAAAKSWEFTISVVLYIIIMLFVIHNFLLLWKRIYYYFNRYVIVIQPYRNLRRWWRISETVNEIYRKKYSFVNYMVRLVSLLLRHKRIEHVLRESWGDKPEVASSNLPIWDWLRKVPISMHLIDRWQLSNIRVTLYWRFLYGIFAAIFLFSIKSIIRILFIYFYTLRVINFFLFYSLYHFFWIKLHISQHLFYEIWKLFISIQNLLTIYWVMDAHVYIARKLFDFLPNFLSALNPETYLTIPATYPPILSYWLRYFMPLNSFPNHRNKYKINFSKSLMLIFLNIILILPISYFFRIISKIFTHLKPIEVKIWYIYYYFYMIYIKIIKNLLFLEISLTFFKILRFIYISIIFILLFCYKYVILFIILFILLHFLLFLFLNMLRDQVPSIAQYSVHIFFICLGGLVIYSWEFFKFFVMSCLHIILFILFRLRYILLIMILLYFGLNSHIISYFLYRWITVLPLEHLYSLGLYWYDMNIPLYIWSWIPNNICLENYHTLVFVNISSFRTLACDWCGMNPTLVLGQRIWYKYHLSFWNLTFWHHIYLLCPVVYDWLANTTMVEVFTYILQAQCQAVMSTPIVWWYDGAWMFLQNTWVGYIYVLLAIFFWIKFQILFTLPYLFHLNWWYIMPDLCSVVTVPIYYMYLAPVGMYLAPIGIFFKTLMPDTVIFIQSFNFILFILYFIFFNYFDFFIYVYKDISLQEWYHMFMQWGYYFYLLFSIKSIYYYYLGFCCDFIHDVCCYFIPNFFFPIIYWPSQYCLFKIFWFINITFQYYNDLFFSYARLLFSDLVTNLGTDTTRYIPMWKNRSFNPITRVPLLLSRLSGSLSYNEGILGWGQFPILTALKYTYIVEYEYIDLTMLYFIAVKKFWISFWFFAGYTFLWVWTTLMHFFFYKKCENLSGYNSHYLWFLFRKNSQKNFMSWIETNDTIEALDYFTDKFLHVNSILPKDLILTDRVEGESAETRKTGVMEITIDVLQKLLEKKVAIRNYRLDFNKDIAEIRKLTKEKSRKNLRMEWKNQTRKFFSDKMNLINSLREKFGFEQTTNTIIEDFSRAIDFDYNSFFLDPKYSAFYNVRSNEYSTLSVFLTRGFRRDKYIRQILINEAKCDMLPLDIALEEFNQCTFEVSDQLFGVLENFMLQFNLTFPHWYWLKESGIWFFMKQKEAILGQEIFVVDEDIDICSFYFIYSWCLPCYILLVMIRLNFGLKDWIELNSIMHDLYIWFKLFFGNQFSAWSWTIYEYYIGFAIYIPFENIPSSDMHDGIWEIYPYWQWEKFDPLGKYGAIQAEHFRALYHVENRTEGVSLLFKNYFRVLQDCLYSPDSYKYRNFSILHWIFSVLMFIYFCIVNFLNLKKIGNLKYSSINIDEGILVHVRRYYQIASIKWKSYLNGINNKT